MSDVDESIPYCDAFTLTVKLADGKSYTFSYKYDPDDPISRRAQLALTQLAYGEMEFSHYEGSTVKLEEFEGKWRIDILNAIPTLISVPAET